uniref:Putative Disease resistance protein n=1 Tax=Davidia involucrata TaxID=16924 RepID=A0A5B7C944_DAVIN
MLGSSIDEKMQTLKSKLERLNCRVADINDELEQAELRSRKKRKREVENWLGNVEKKRNELISLEQNVQQSGILSPLLFGERAENMIREMEELVEQGQFSEGLLLDVHETKGEPLLTTKLIGEAFQNNLQKILDCLKKDELLSIGIYGMGGAGKTTLATHIHKLLSEKSDHTFDHVYWVTVSHDFSIHKLQNDIAKAVNLDLSDVDDVRRRAARLSQALIRRKKCVLILDDVWHHLRLEEVGICPMVNGCKLILTTRFLDVCHRMGCRENIKVDSLPEKESWDLFRETLGHGLALPPDIENIAMSVAKRCGGLPLGITVMAGSMRGVTDICEWKNVLEELEKPTTGQREMEDEVFPLLKLSYDRLKGAELKHCFLYCALYPEDWEIERDELIGYFIAEGLIDRTKSMQAKLYMGHTLLNKLERACLLESCKNYEGKRYIKMHDLMREMALEITRRESPRVMVKAGLQLRKIPDEPEWKEDLDKVSLMDNYYIREIPEGTSPRCPNLSTLLFQVNNILRWIPYSFFVHMPALRVLDLSWTGIRDLPESISELESLTALFLQYCSKLKYVPPLGNLRALQVLNLSWTAIEEVPQGMEMLVNLNCLYMEGMKNLKMLPTGILRRLSHLQVLRLDHGLKYGTVLLDELVELKQLVEFTGHLYDLCDFNRFVKSQCYSWRLRIYHLVLGNEYSDFLRCSNEACEYDKQVSVRNCRLKGGGEEYRVLLPHDIQELLINGRHDANSLCDIISPLSLNNARDLKNCHISECDGIEYILPLPFSNEIEVEEDIGEESPCVPLQSLECLELYGLAKLSALIKWGRVNAPLPPAGTFSNLKFLMISDCNKIKKLIPPGLLQHLQNLTSISVCNCDEMEEIIAAEYEEEGMGACSSSSNNNSSSSFFNNNNNNAATIFTLPKFKAISLECVPKLKSICKGVMACDSIEQIHLIWCPRLKRVPFSLPLVNGQPSPPHALRSILTERITWESLDWDHPNAKNVLQPLVTYSYYDGPE